MVHVPYRRCHGLQAVLHSHFIAHRSHILQPLILLLLLFVCVYEYLDRACHCHVRRHNKKADLNRAV